MLNTNTIPYLTLEYVVAYLRWYGLDVTVGPFDSLWWYKAETYDEAQVVEEALA